MANRKNTARQGEGTRSKVALEDRAEEKKRLQRERQRKCRELKRRKFLHLAQNASQSLPLPSDLQRQTTRLAAQIGPMLHTLTCHKGPEFQRMAIEKVLKHPLLINVVPDVILNSDKYQAAYDVCSSLKAGWQVVKGAHSIDDLRSRNVLTSMVVSDSTRSFRATARVTGIKKGSLSSGYARRKNVQPGAILQWAVGFKAKRIDALSEETQFIVVEWWTSNTRVSPTGRDVVRHRDSPTAPWIKHPAHYLLEPQVI
jgi:hypothetical protein